MSEEKPEQHPAVPQIQQRIATDQAVEAFVNRIAQNTFNAVRVNVENHKATGKDEVLDAAMVAQVIHEFAELLRANKHLKPSKEADALIAVATKVMPAAAIAARKQVEANRIIVPGR